jgi:hypothetical protein
VLRLPLSTALSRLPASDTQRRTAAAEHQAA